MVIQEEEMRLGKGGDGGKKEVGEQQTREMNNKWRKIIIKNNPMLA